MSSASAFVKHRGVALKALVRSKTQSTKLCMCTAAQRIDLARPKHLAHRIACISCISILTTAKCRALQLATTQFGAATAFQHLSIAYV
jgi:hypothetical protein